MSTLKNLLVKAGLVKYGDFTLKSGAKSRIYFDLRSIVASPTLLQEVVLEIEQNLFMLVDSQWNCVVGVPTGAVPLAAAFAHYRKLPIAMVREAPKKHGLGKQVEGSENQSVILIEDVVTTGDSVEKFAKILEEAGRKIAIIICVLDRGGVANLVAKGYNVRSLLSMEQFMPCAPAQRIIDYSQTVQSNLIVALDDVDPVRTLSIMRDIAPHVAGFKLHMDIYQFGDPLFGGGFGGPALGGKITKDDFVTQISVLKKQYGFTLIEDRKFADIAVIVQKQWNSYSPAYRHIVDMVTVHSICGPDVLDLLCKEVGLLLIHQLSTAGNLITLEYSNATVAMAERTPNVVGFISQSRVVDAHKNPVVPYLTFSPGVNLDTKSDKHGQQWSNTKNTDFVIVGRGITEADDPVEAAARYQAAFWKSPSKL